MVVPSVSTCIWFVSTEAEITTDPVVISPYTTGNVVPGLAVFCIPLKLHDSLGSASLSGGSGKGNNKSLTP